MIAEDSPIQATMLRRRLVKEGYTVRVGKDGAEALQLMRERKPNILVSDIEMPEMNGYELCRAVKDDPQLNSVPVILLSTLANPEDIIDGLHAGADNYVTKPYDEDYLISRMQSLLSTPIDDTEINDEQILEVKVAGKMFVVKPGRYQALNLLVSTFENAVEKNKELTRVNEQLTIAKDQVQKRNHLLESLNDQLATANDKMREDLEAGAIVQQSLLPSELPSVEGVNIAWNYSPCDELAGDFLNIHQLDDEHLGMYVVDVSGHGVAASLLAVSISRVLIPTNIHSSLLLRTVEGLDKPQIIPPAEVLSELNRRFPMETWGNKHFTITYGVFNTKTHEFRYVSAGHCPIILMAATGQPEFLEAEGFAIGWLDDAEWDEQRVQLKPGDRLLIYSDGIPEAMNSEKEQLGDEELLKAFAEARAQSLTDSLTNLIDEVEAWCGESGPDDDVSLLGIEIEA